MHEFDSKDLKRLFGIPASQLRSLIRAGHIRPLKKAGRLSDSFQDLIVLRTAGSLRAAKIPAQRINRTLREIRDSLPGELPLSGLSIVAVGDRIVVREGQALREPATGQYTLDLEVTSEALAHSGYHVVDQGARETMKGTDRALFGSAFYCDNGSLDGGGDALGKLPLKLALGSFNSHPATLIQSDLDV